MQLNSTLPLMPMAHPVATRKPQAQAKENFGAVAQILAEGVEATGELAQRVKVVEMKKGLSLLVDLGDQLRAVVLPGGEIKTSQGTVKFKTIKEAPSVEAEGAIFIMPTKSNSLSGFASLFQFTGKGTRTAPALSDKVLLPLIETKLGNGGTTRASLMEASMAQQAMEGINDFHIGVTQGRVPMLDRMLEASTVLPRDINIHKSVVGSATGDLGEAGVRSLAEIAKKGQGTSIMFTDALIKNWSIFSQNAQQTLQKLGDKPGMVDLHELVPPDQIKNYGQALIRQNPADSDVAYTIETMKTGLSRYPMRGGIEQPTGDVLARLVNEVKTGQHKPFSWTGATLWNNPFTEMASKQYAREAQGGLTREGSEIGIKKSPASNALIQSAWNQGGSAHFMADTRPEPVVQFIDGGSDAKALFNIASTTEKDKETGVSFITGGSGIHKPTDVSIGGQNKRVMLIDPETVKQALAFYRQPDVDQLVSIK